MVRSDRMAPARRRLLLVSGSRRDLRALLALEPALARFDRTWVSVRTSEAETRLAGRDVQWRQPLRPRPFARVVRAMHDAYSALRVSRPRAVVAAGATIAVPFFVAARVLRIPAVWVDTDAPPAARGRAVRVCAHLATFVVASRPELLVRHPRSARPSGAGLALPPAWGGPFAGNPTRRYSFAFDRVRGRAGRMLDLGCGEGDFLIPAAARLDQFVAGADYSAGYLGAVRAASPLPLVRVGRKDPLPFRTGAFTTITLLDVLEHVADEDHTLAEIHRVLVPGGLLICTVPHRHALSFLDPDDAKFRWPRVHKRIYSARYGTTTYRERFVEVADGMRGDLDVERTRHTNYDAAALMTRLEHGGFELVGRDGANLLGRQLAPVARLAPAALTPLFDVWLRRDARFHSANLFVTALRR